MSTVTGLGDRLQTLRHVGRVADRRVVHLEVAPDRTDDHRAGVDADADAQLDAAADGKLRVQLRQRVADRERGEDAAIGSVLVGDGRSEQRHDAVAGELRHDALDAIDLAGGDRDVLLEEIAILLRVEALGDGRRADQIAEHHGHELALARNDALTGADLGGEDGGDLARGRCVTSPAATVAVGRSAFRPDSGAAGAPHSGQKRNPGSIALPQVGQPRTARVPQA